MQRAPWAVDLNAGIAVASSLLDSWVMPVAARLGSAEGIVVGRSAFCGD